MISEGKIAKYLLFEKVKSSGRQRWPGVFFSVGFRQLKESSLHKKAAGSLKND